MDNTNFEGYPGIYLNNITFSNDTLLLVVLILLSAFALVFRLNTALFGRMISNTLAGEQRQNIFDTTQKDSFLFNIFMTFQALLLSSIFIFLTGTDCRFFIKPETKTTLLSIAVLFVVLFAFYLLKRGFYCIFGYVFAENDTRKAMLVNCQALFCIWGLSLYIPVLWILFVGKYFYIAYIIFIISYLTFRTILVYRVIHMFFHKNMGLLFLSSYLCGQEIIPLVFLYEGLIYIYNIIETNNIWQ
jgi:hypothetical protein